MEFPFKEPETVTIIFPSEDDVKAGLRVVTLALGSLNETERSGIEVTINNQRTPPSLTILATDEQYIKAVTQALENQGVPHFFQLDLYPFSDQP